MVSRLQERKYPGHNVQKTFRLNTHSVTEKLTKIQHRYHFFVVCFRQLSLSLIFLLLQKYKVRPTVSNCSK